MSNAAPTHSSPATDATAAAPGPARIFIVRHGERVDHMQRAWRATAARPHDSPLTANGKAMAHKLGLYLAAERGVRVGDSTTAAATAGTIDPHSVIVLSSPLQRCIETSHGIIVGLLKGSGLGHLIANSTGEGEEGVGGQEAPTHHLHQVSGLPVVPIHLEPGVIEGQYWMNNDIADGQSQGNKGVCLLEGPGVNADAGGAFLTSAHFHRHVSPYVVPEGTLVCPHRGGRRGFGDVAFSFDARRQRVLEADCPHTGRRGDDVQLRCFHTITAISRSPALSGKTVIIVGHGQTTTDCVRGLLPSARAPGCPGYTAFTEVTSGEVRALNPHQAAAEDARLCSNLRSSKKGSASLTGSQPPPPVTYRRAWAVAADTRPFSTPHLAPVVPATGRE